MKLTKTANGKQTIKMSRKEWTNIGKKAGWTDKLKSLLVKPIPSGKFKCNSCGGRGMSQETDFGGELQPSPCSTCGGKGYLDEDPSTVHSA